ncbi:MAG: biotin--[acetyl-CoA-carboxylase] ligase [Candidatus Eremiobacteraeota bacterium]|nr:biotin--[acetyl-CoA-carboxylase] ligase [Candidatus Eremiobacteraeota bacterium]
MGLLDVALVRSRVSAFPRFNRVEYSASVASTNALAVERLYSNDSLGISFVTESQTEGRGRAGRQWVSPPQAGVLLSTVLPTELPPAALPAVGFWTSLAVAQAVKELTGTSLGMKWPNDLLLGGVKCAGILAEGQSRAQQSRVAVGVGVNVNRPAEVPAEIAAIAAWLSDVSGDVDRTALLLNILGCYERSYDELLNDPAAIIARWSHVAALEGKYVAVKALDGSILHEGIVRGIDREGSLIVETTQGRKAVRLGEIDVLS